MNIPPLIFDEDLLRKHCKPIKHFEEAHQIAHILRKALAREKGLGIAAPQLGIHKQVALVKVNREILLINPKITRRWGIFSLKEGCLSFLGQEIECLRNTKVEIESAGQVFTVDGIHTFKQREEIDIPRSLLEVACLQHEVDHLFGILIHDRAKPYEKERFEKLNSITRGI